MSWRIHSVVATLADSDAVRETLDWMRPAEALLSHAGHLLQSHPESPKAKVTAEPTTNG